MGGCVCVCVCLCVVMLLCDYVIIIEMRRLKDFFRGGGCGETLDNGKKVGRKRGGFRRRSFGWGGRGIGGLVVEGCGGAVNEGGML